MDKIQFENRMREIDKRYSEYFAQALLAAVYDHNFVYSTTAESPDIHLTHNNSSHGVEVTRLICSYYKTLKRYSKAWAKQGLSIEQIVQNMPEELKDAVGLNHEGKVVPLKSLGETIANRKMKVKLAEILDTKLDRLQHYKMFDKNSLFVFATELNKTITPPKILSAFLNKSKLHHYTIRFDNIMVFTYDKLVVFDLNKYDKSYAEIKINQEMVDFCDKYARRKIKKPNIVLKDLLFEEREPEK